MTKKPSIEPGSLAEHLYNHHGFDELDHLLDDHESFDLLKQQWALSEAQCITQITLAMHFIKRD